MAQFAIRRILWMIPTLFFVSLITFFVMHSTPGGPFDALADKLTMEQIDKLEQQFGLHRPLFFDPERAQLALNEGKGSVAAVDAFFGGQYFTYFKNLAKGNLGPSLSSRGRAVEDILFESKPGQPF